MTRARIALALALASCGDNTTASTDSAVDAFASCAAIFKGNFVETSSAASCATLSPTLELTVESKTLHSSLAVSIDLGATPVPGAYSSETVSTWSATAFKAAPGGVGSGGCIFSAGGAAIPSGSFTLALTSIDHAVPHGSLSILQYVLTLPETDCGDVDTETVNIAF